MNSQTPKHTRAHLRRYYAQHPDEANAEFERLEAAIVGDSGQSALAIVRRLAELPTSAFNPAPPICYKTLIRVLQKRRFGFDINGILNCIPFFKHLHKQADAVLFNLDTETRTHLQIAARVFRKISI